MSDRTTIRDGRDGATGEDRFVFKGPWTSQERAAMSKVIARSDADSVRICVKTRPGGRTLFLVVESREGRWEIRTGESIHELAVQSGSDRL